MHRVCGWFPGETSVLLSAANSDKPIPAGILGTEPVDTDPFRYRDPAKN